MGQEHTPAELSDEQRANLTKLAAYLRTLPPEYPDFAMDDYTSGHSEYAAKTDCGTAACAVGHGPNAGIAPIGREDWYEYSTRCLAPDPWSGNSEWDWCFHSRWAKVDNTAHGAAARIDYMLAYGVPEDAPDQRNGYSPLCYTALVNIA